MKILILGHRGMLGCDLMKTLSRDHDVLGRDIDDIDITSEADCHDVVSTEKPDCLINAAAYTNVDACETEQDASYAVNALGVRHLAEACEQNGVKLVHFSTDYVFDGTKGSPYVEEDACNPINHYGRTKLEGEIFLQTLSRNYLLIRTSWLYGANGKNFVKTILEKGRSEKNLRVVDDQIGSPTYTKDLAGAVTWLIASEQTGIFHVTNRGSCSWYDFAVKILEIGQLEEVSIQPLKSDALLRPAMRPSYSVLSNRKFQEKTRKIMRPWQIALDDYLDATRSQWMV